MPSSSDLPDYAPMLASYHRAFARELAAMVASLPLSPGDRVLDVACGDGSYSRWLEERVRPEGYVCAIDASPAFLARASDVARRDSSTGRIALVQADLRRLPFHREPFDLAWCAQSLYSLPDPVAALRRMARVVRAGGTVAVLENDTLHHILLPWPVELELAIRRAELRGHVAESARPRKFYVARRLRRVFREAGLVDVRSRTWANDRQAPLTPDERAFLEDYLDDLKRRAFPHLTPALARRLEPLVEPRSPDFLPDDPDLCFTCIDHVAWATRP